MTTMLPCVACQLCLLLLQCYIESVSQTEQHLPLPPSARPRTCMGLPLAGKWVVVDKRAHQFFATHRQTNTYKINEPVVARKYKFEFTAVAAGCASRSLQVCEFVALAHTRYWLHVLVLQALLHALTAVYACIYV